MMSTNHDSIVIQQCLHGYDRGHSLIESSSTLPKESTSLILRMSDASSIGYTENSPSYLTGYPLPEIGAYALARTWPAKNMPRPGCVWTHTLLIKFEYLALFNNLGVLNQIFKCPDSESFDFFNKIIKLNKSIQSTKCEKGSVNSVSTILSELYLDNEPHVFLPYSPDSDFSVLSVWSKQWPKLRRNFKFRTYASKSSTLNDYFDLCFYEASAYEYEEKNFKVNELKIIKVLVDDIFDFSNDGLKEFLWRYGADSKGLRDSYVPLFQIYNNLMLLLKNKDATNFNSYISEILKHLGVSKSLEKYMFFLILRAHYNELSRETTNFILKKIVDIKPTEINDHLKDFSRFISKIPLIQANEFLLSKLKNEELSNSFVGYLPNGTLLNLVNEHPEVIHKILISKPHFILDDKIIKLLNKKPQLIKNISFDNNSLLNEFILKCIDHEYWKVLEKLTKYKQMECLPHLLGILHNLSYLKLESVTKNVLLKSTGFVKSILTGNSHISLELLTALSKGISVGEFDNDETDPWLAALYTIKLNEETLPENLAVYLLIRGLKNIGSHPHLLLSVSFDTIHHLIATNKLSNSNWEELNKLLPITNYFFWNYWDRCKKLRNGVIEAYRKYKMPIERFIYITNDKVTLKFLLIELENGYENKYFLKDLLTYLLDKDINIEEDFSDELLNQLHNIERK